MRTTGTVRVRTTCTVSMRTTGTVSMRTTGTVCVRTTCTVSMRTTCTVRVRTTCTVSMRTTCTVRVRTTGTANMHTTGWHVQRAYDWHGQHADGAGSSALVRAALISVELFHRGVGTRPPSLPPNLPAAAKFTCGDSGLRLQPHSPHKPCRQLTFCFGCRVPPGPPS
eukprot:351188-Chlamydomonas_euryale.AAC.3